MISKMLSHKSLLYGAICFLTMFLLLPGCGDGRPKRVPVSGVVLIDGKPVTHGFIRFHPPGRPATGALDDQGRFTLTCFGDDDGVMPGTHPVSVTAFESLSSNKGTRWHAPKMYTLPKTSGITKTVEGPTESMVIELTWDGGKPFVEKVLE